MFLSEEREPGSEPVVRRAARPLPPGESPASTVLLRPAARIERSRVAEALKEFEGALEEGLRAIDAQIPCGACGEIDLLAMDRTSRLAIIDFEIAPSDELLVRGLGHLDWAAGNVANLRRMLRGYSINFSLPPRLVLLAPEISLRLTSAARQVAGVQIDWFRYLMVDTPGRTGILFERVPLLQSG